MTTQVHSTTPHASRNVAITLIAAAIVAFAANTAVAFAGIAAGASASFAPLTIPVYGAFTLIGLMAGFVGWRIIRSRARSPRRALSVVVPVLLVLSFIPDVITMFVGFIPNGSVTGYVALMLMHVVVVAVGVPVFQRIAPVR